MEGNYLKKFEEQYRRLNKQQKEAVDALEGPVMVMAGPGTGKTQVLTLRIANIILKTDTPPDAILALTFTEAAAANMRRRLVAIIGGAGYYPTITTFHSFADSVIQNYPEYFPSIIGSKPIDAVRQMEIMETILETVEGDELKPVGNKFFYVKEILALIGKLKKDGFGPDEYETWLKQEQENIYAREDLYNREGKIKSQHQSLERKLKRSKEFLAVYRAYQQELRERHWYDFEEMILETVAALEAREDLRLELQEKYHYILIDEHQDTNLAQNRIAELLGSFFDNPNIFAVGDAKQAIYKFQGASLENFLFFKNKYQGARVIVLNNNYRSTQTILDAAHSLIRKNGVGDEEALVSSRLDGEKIRTLEFESQDEETRFIAKEIASRIKKGERPEEIAVLTRENKETKDIAEALRRQGVPFQIESDINIIEDRNIKKLIYLFEAIHDFSSDEKLIRALHLDFLNLEPIDIFKVMQRQTEKRQPILTMMEMETELQAAGVAETEKFKETAKKMSAWKRASVNEHWLSFFEKVMKESGWLAHFLKDGGYQDTEKLRRLFEELKRETSIKSDYNLGDFIQYINRLKEHNIHLNFRLTRNSERVKIMTAHRAKGQEFKIVYLAGAVDRKWGNRRLTEFFLKPVSLFAGSATEKSEEERRLFYMALTRAKEEVIITSHRFNNDGQENNPTRFLEEVDGILKIQENQRETDEPFFEEEKGETDKQIEEETLSFLRETFAKRGLSATALNNYLECPAKFFYNNLLLIPQAKGPAAGFGSAIHRTLRNFFEGKKKRLEIIAQDFLPAEFELQLKREILSLEDYKRMLKKGKEVLLKYHDYYQDNWNFNTQNEIKLEVEIENGITIKGILDKLEFEDGGVVVTDYKTGQPKSRNEIEGKTQNSLGNYKRQLIFYKLLLDAAQETRYKMKQGVIDFVEPTKSGAFKKEIFIITDEEVAELKEIIRRVWKEITELKFINKKCDDKQCEYCELMAMIRKKM